MMRIRKRARSLEPIPKKRRRNDAGDESDCIVLDDEIIPHQTSPVIDLDTVGEVDINDGSESDEGIDISLIIPGKNGGARPDYDRNESTQKIRLFKKQHKTAYEEMQAAILHHYEANIQREDTILWKLAAKEELLAAIRTIFPRAELYAVGSTANGCGSFNSDMDVCAVIPEVHWNDSMALNKKRKVPVVANALHKIRRVIEKNVSSLKKVLFIPAVVPILQIEFKEKFKDLDVDLNINNFAGIRNTHLIRHYTFIDERFPIICLLIKHWAIVQDINSAQVGTLNSYSLILLVLHFMQCAVQPSILPNLYELEPEMFNVNVPVNKLKWTNQKYPHSENHEELTAVLLKFFEYYADFDFKKYAISIRLAKVFEKNLLPKKERDYPIFIEEPHDRKNTARCVQPSGYYQIIEGFQNAWKTLNSSQHPSLENLGIRVPVRKSYRP